jgi:Cu-Zn family superoxide dismutase
MEDVAMRLTVTTAMTALLVTGCATAPGTDRASLSAPLRLADGRVVGTVRLAQTAAGVAVTIGGAGLMPGPLGAHLHAVGRCEGPGFTTAGPHWNPAMRKHGHLSPDGPHLGDLGNLAVEAGGVVRAERVAPGATLSGGASPLLDADGAALVIHARGDDERTDPSGNSGDRIACAAFPGFTAR